MTDVTVVADLGDVPFTRAQSIGGIEVDATTPVVSGPRGPQGLQGQPGAPGDPADTAQLAAALQAHINSTNDVHGIGDAEALDQRTQLGGVSPLQWYRNGKAGT